MKFVFHRWFSFIDVRFFIVKKNRRVWKFKRTFEFRFEFDIFYKRYRWFFIQFVFQHFQFLIFFVLYSSKLFFFWYSVIIFVRFCFTFARLNNIALRFFFIQYINCFIFLIFNKLINISFSFNSIFFNIKCQSETRENCFSFIIFCVCFDFFVNFDRIRPIKTAWWKQFYIVFW